MAMRRLASACALTVCVVTLGGVASAAPAGCVFDPGGILICEDDGVVTVPGIPGDPGVMPDTGGMRYLYQRTDPVVGDCYYWSNTPGGLDTWDPANDAAVINLVIRNPECPPVAAVDPETRAWEIFRSWSLALPLPSLQPADHGITGVPTYLATNQPSPIVHSEVLPDGRTLNVRADVIRLVVAWGDGHTDIAAPELATSYPDGGVTHTYLLKTCSAHYREHHPSGRLCHPTLDHYDVVSTFRWSGSYDIGGGWVALGTLDRTATVAYDVDEARGVPIP